MIDLEKLNEEDALVLRELISNHHRLTGSTVARSILDDFRSCLKFFVKVMPKEYKHILGKKNSGFNLSQDEVSDG
jgi:glutamate synthase domain-containing protein 3